MQWHSRDACGVELDDTFIIIGGHNIYAPNEADKSVVRYSSRGVFEVLPSLTEGRYGHACSSYLSDNTERVSQYHSEFCG